MKAKYISDYNDMRKIPITILFHKIYIYWKVAVWETPGTVKWFLKCTF